MDKVQRATKYFTKRVWVWVWFLVLLVLWKSGSFFDTATGKLLLGLGLSVLVVADIVLIGLNEVEAKLETKLGAKLETKLDEMNRVLNEIDRKLSRRA